MKRTMIKRPIEKDFDAFLQRMIKKYPASDVLAQLSTEFSVAWYAVGAPIDEIVEQIQRIHDQLNSHRESN